MFWGFKVDSQAKFKCVFFSKAEMFTVDANWSLLEVSMVVKISFLSLFLLDLHPFGSMQGGNVFVQRLHSIKPDGTGFL